MSKYIITDDSHLATLEAHLAENLYIGGHSPSAEDALVFEQFAQAGTEPNQEKNLNLWSWYLLIVLFTEGVRSSWKSIVAAPAQGKKEAPKKEAKKEEPKVEAVKDECDDLFGDDDEDEVAKLNELKKKKDANKAAAVKTGPIQKSIIIVDIKVWETEQDLDALAARVLNVEKDGLTWKTEYKLADVAFGVKKLVMGMVIEDEKVSIDDIIEELQGWEDDIQSVDIVTFNKI